MLKLADNLKLPADEAVTQKAKRVVTHRGGRPLLTKAEKLERQRDRARTWRAANRERLRKYFADYRAAHPELQAYHAEYFAANKSKYAALSRRPDVKQKRKMHAAANRERINKVHRAWRAANRDQVLATERRSRAKRAHAKRAADRRWRQQNGDKFKAGVQAAKAKKPDHYRMIQRHSSLARRSRKRAAPVERVSRKRLITRDGRRCHLCREAIGAGELTFDHLIPVVRGGAYAEWNLMSAHDRCNKSRGTRRILAEETRACAEAYISGRTVEAAA